MTTTEEFGDIEARDSTTAFVGGGSLSGNAKIYRTTNGGQSWEAVYTATGPESYWHWIHFFDALNGMALSYPPTGSGAFLIVKTTDGGATWTPIANPPNAKPNEFVQTNVFFHDNLHGWFGTGYTTQSPESIARVFRTTDSGNTWNGVEAESARIIWSVSFISPMVGVCVSLGSSVSLQRSTDGGQTWAPVANLPVSNILGLHSTMGVHTPSLDQLWVTGAVRERPPRAFILSSLDGGVTWQQQSLPSLSISFIGITSAVSFGASNDSVRAWVNAPHTTLGSQILTYLNRIGQLTAVKEQASLPTNYSLSQNYPNPFWSAAISPVLSGGNPSTTIAYSIPTPQLVELKVYDVLGHEVATLVNERKVAGNYQVSFEAGKLTSGIYLYRLEAGDPSAGSGQDFVEIKKMILVR